MTNTQRRAFWPVLIVATLSVSTWALTSGRPRVPRSSGEKKPQSSAMTQPGTRAQAGEQSSSSSDSIQNPAAANREEWKVTALPIVLKQGGFVPMEIKRPAGDFFFSVGNQSGLREVVFRLDREGGSKINEAHVKNDRLRWRQMVKLTPGTYVLSEASHPSWVCRIVITAR